MHRLCDRCCEYHDTNGGMVLVDDDAYCNECYEQMIDEDEPPDDPWGNAHGSPMYWIPPEGDEYWDERDAEIANVTKGEQK